jgi:hypothetical protein
VPALYPPDDPGNPCLDSHGKWLPKRDPPVGQQPRSQADEKGARKEAKPCYTESVPMENRNGIMVDLRVSQATSLAECEQGWKSWKGFGGLHRITVTADKGYDRAEFVAG